VPPRRVNPLQTTTYTPQRRTAPVRPLAPAVTATGVRVQQFPQVLAPAGGLWGRLRRVLFGDPEVNTRV
jgi:hypothetical protein